MANYIYGITHPETKECYIGQSTAAIGNPYQRFQDHILRAYGYKKSLGDDLRLINLIRRHNLNSFEFYIYTDTNNYGITDKQYQHFCHIFSPSSQSLRQTNKQGTMSLKTGKNHLHLQQQVPGLGISGYQKIDIAEILHIANAVKRGGKVINKDMGGQTQHGLLKGTSTWAFRKSDSPQQVINLLENIDNHLSDIQSIIDAEAHKLFSDKAYGGEKFVHQHGDQFKVNKSYQDIIYPLVQEGLSQEQVIRLFTRRIRHNLLQPIGSTLDFRFHMEKGNRTIIADITKMLTYRINKIKPKTYDNILAELLKPTQTFSTGNQFTISLHNLISITTSDTISPQGGASINLQSQQNDLITQEVVKETAYTIFRRAVRETKQKDIYQHAFQQNGAFHIDPLLQVALIHKDTTLSATVHQGYIDHKITNDIVMRNGRTFYSRGIQYTINQDDPGQETYDPTTGEIIYYRQKQRVNNFYVGHKPSKRQPDGTSNTGDSLIY